MNEICHGCNEDNPVDEDHYHQYINILGNTTSCWRIDETNFRDPSEAAIYIEEILECTSDEAFQYIHSLPKKYN